MKQLSKKNLLLVGLTLFSMFFGAGNLIFPPFLGAQAGTNTWIAMLGFAVSAIGFPVLGVVAVARSGGLENLAGRVHPKFAFVFTLLIYLSIGPCLAIPRTAGTSFEMVASAVPSLGMSSMMEPARVLYSIVFFGIAFVLALKPDKLTDRLGKILTPCLLILIAVIFVGCILHPAGTYGAPTAAYTGNPFVKGFLEGYQTMDTIAALNFGIIISLNIRAMGISEESVVIKETVKAGLIAGGVLLLIYASLAHVGAVTGGAFGIAGNGAGTLSTIVQFLFGRFGMIMLALIFFIACLNTCVGLISCCSKYFTTIIPALGYRAWAIIFVIASLFIANIGLNKILEISVPVLNAIYPVAIVLIILSMFHPILGRFKKAYSYGTAFTAVVSILLAMDQSKIMLAPISNLLQRLPFFEAGLGWIVPALMGVALGALVSGIAKRQPISL